MSHIINPAPLSLLVPSDPTIIESWPNFVVLTSSQTWVVPAGVKEIVVAVMGGGGGGGAGTDIDTGPYSGIYFAGAGGGGAGYNVDQFDVTPGQNISMVIGGGGAGGIRCTNEAAVIAGDFVGATGGTSSVVGYLSAGGGIGGSWGPEIGLGVFGGGNGGRGWNSSAHPDIPGSSGLGANDNVLDENRDRAAITNYYGTFGDGGGGGAAYLGNGGYGGLNGTNEPARRGDPGSGPGAGGGGGAQYLSNVGGAGISGVIEIRWM